MQEMSRNMADLIEQNKKLMEQLGVVETSKTKKVTLIKMRNTLVASAFTMLSSATDVYKRQHVW